MQFPMQFYYLVAWRCLFRHLSFKAKMWFFLTTWRPRQLFASQNVDMNMVDGLAALHTIVEHQAIAFI